MSIIVLSRSRSFELHLLSVFETTDQVLIYSSLDAIERDVVSGAKLVLIHASSFKDEDEGEVDVLLEKIKKLSPSPIGVAADLPSLEEMLRLSSLGGLAYFNSFMLDIHYRQMEQFLLIGHRWYLPDLLESAMQIAYQAVVPAASVFFAKLTRREQEIALVVSKGASNKDTARQCGITERTVKAHLTSIFEKCGVSDRVSLTILINEGNLPTAVSG